MKSMKWLTIITLLLSFSARLCAEEVVICRNLLMNYDVTLLEAELRLVEDKYLLRHPPNDNWTGIPLRNAMGSETQEGLELNNSLNVSAQKMVSCKNTKVLEQLPYISTLLDEIAQRFDATVGLVRISNVPSGKKIAPHSDGRKFDIDKGSIYRLHIPIITGEDVQFEIANKKYNLESGNLYYTNVSKQHSVTNDGPLDRIHLVIDVQANDALYEHILASPEVNPLM